MNIMIPDLIPLYSDSAVYIRAIHFDFDSQENCFVQQRSIRSKEQEWLSEVHMYQIKSEGIKIQPNQTIEFGISYDADINGVKILVKVGATNYKLSLNNGSREILAQYDWMPVVSCVSCNCQDNNSGLVLSLET